MARADILAGRSYVELYVRNTRFVRGLRQARNVLNRFGTDMVAVGRQAAVATAVMMAPLISGASVFASFDDGMREVKAVSASTEAEFQKLTATAKNLGRTTSFTAIEVSALMAELGRAGFEADSIDQMTGSVLSLARATKTEGALSAGLMAAAIRQFGLGADDAGRVADGFTAAANKSFNTVEQLGEALKFAGPVARDFNLSFEDTLAVLGGLGNVGVQGSAAGTAVRRLLTLTGAEAEKLNRIFGVEFLNAAGNARPLVDVLGEVNQATENLGTGERAAKFNEAFGLLGITGASAIGRSAGDVRALSDEIKNAGGIAADTAGEMDAGLGGAFRIIMSAAEGVQIALGEAIAEPLQELTQDATGFLGIVTSLIEENSEAVVTFGKWAAVVGAVAAGLLATGLAASAVATAIGGLLAIVSFASTALAAGLAVLGTIGAVFTSPLTLAIVGVSALIAVFLQATGLGQTLLASWFTFTEKLRGLFGRLKETALETFAGIRAALGGGDLQLAGQIAMVGLRLIVTQGMEAIQGIIGGVWGDTLGQFSSQILGGDFAGAWETAVLSMATIWENFSNGIVTMFVDAAKAIIEVWSKTIDGITNFILKKASGGGAFNSALKAVSGVDLAAEQKRQDKLNSALGLENDQGGLSQILDDIEAGGGGLAGSIRDKLNAGLDELQSASDKRGIGAAAEQAAGIDGSSEVESIKAELAALTAKAAKLREEANAEPSDKSAADGSAPGGGANGKGGTDGPGGLGGGKASVVTSSAAALLAIGQGGGAQEPVVREIRDLAREQRKHRRLLERQNELAERQEMHHP